MARKRAGRKPSTPLELECTKLRLSREDLPTPTTTSKDQPCCPCWDLHEASAASNGNEAVRRYLISGGDPAADQWGNSALHVAAYEGNFEIARVLLSYKADVGQRNRAQETPLHLACRQGRARIVRLLLENGADPRAQDVCGRFPRVLEGICSDSKCQIEHLLERSNELSGLGSIKKRVHVQICHDNMRGVERLLKGGDSLDVRDGASCTLLHRACEEANVQTVRKLLSLGAAVNATEKRRQTPLHRACERGRLDVIRLLLDEGGADIRARAKVEHEPLHVACLGDWGEIVRFLLTRGADVESVDKNGKRCIHLAVEGNRLEAIRELLKQGCDVGATLSDRLTRPLHIACQRGYERAAMLLLDHGANPSARGPNGLTPLHLAAKEAKLSIVELLIAHKAELKATDDRGRTPLQSTTNRLCKETLKEAELREERAATAERKKRAVRRDREKTVRSRDAQRH